MNDDDLVNKTNGEAMEALRNAMHTEGPIPGCIKISVARKIEDGPTPTPDHSQGKANDLRLPLEVERKVSQTDGGNTPGTPNSLIESMRNPVLDRITGENPNANKLR